MRSNDSATVKAPEEFFKLVGLGRSMEPERFRRRIQKRFGELATHLLEAIIEQADSDVDDVWRLKNRDLELSLAMSAQFMGDFYRCYSPWLQSMIGDDDVTSILDLGCDNGILACCYASMFRKAQVLGIDKRPEGLACAIELSHRLGLTNIKFREVDAMELSGVLAAERFDLITATMTYHSVLRIPPIPVGLSLSEVDLPDTSRWKSILSDTAQLLSENGKFVSVERLTSSSAFLWWVGVLTGCGLHINWPASDVLRYTDTAEPARLPVLVCDRRQHSVDQSVYDVLAFAAKPELMDLAKRPFEGDIAEALLEAFGDKELIWGVEGICPEAQIERFEVWAARTIILAYDYTSNGRRRLVIGPSHERKECIDHARNSWQKRSYARTRQYESTKERDCPGGLQGKPA